MTKPPDVVYYACISYISRMRTNINIAYHHPEAYSPDQTDEFQTNLTAMERYIADTWGPTPLKSP